jgi:hypothetical protein
VVGAAICAAVVAGAVVAFRDQGETTRAGAPPSPAAGRERTWTAPVVGATEDGFVVVEGIGADTVTFMTSDGEQLGTEPLPFADPLYRPRVSSGSGGRVVVVGIPCERPDVDDFVECEPGGLSAAVLDVASRRWTAVADGIVAEPGTQATYVAGIAGDVAVVGVGLQVFALPIDGGEVRALPDLPFRPTEGLCASGSTVVAARRSGDGGAEPEPGVTATVIDGPSSPVRVATLDVTDGGWSAETGTPASYSSVDAFSVGCSGGVAVAVPWGPSVDPTAPEVTHRLDAASGRWQELAAMPAHPGVVTFGATIDGSVDLFAQDGAATVLTLDADGAWVVRERDDGLEHPVRNAARVGDRYVAVDESGEITTGELR